MGDAQLTAQMLLLAAVFDAGRSKNKVVEYWANNKQDIKQRTYFTDDEKEYLEQGEFLTPAGVTAGEINIGNLPMSKNNGYTLRVLCGERRLNVPQTYKRAPFYTATVKVLRYMDEQA